MTNEDFQSLTRSQKVKKVLPKVLPVLLLSVILPTADVGTDLVLITKLYTGIPDCVWSDAMGRYYEEYWKCFRDGPDQYCTPENNKNNNNSVCQLESSSDSQYLCRYFGSRNEWKDYDQCEVQGVDKYCSNQTSNPDVCGEYTYHPKVASSLLFFFLLNYIMGLVTCVRLEGRKWAPLIAALLTVYPQYCKWSFSILPTFRLRIEIFLINTNVLAALRLIKLLYQNPVTGMRKKSEYEQNIGLSEAFLEAVPTTLIIFFSTFGRTETDDGWSTNTTLDKILTDDGSTLFWITFVLSLLSASFGLAKCLKNGVAGTFQHGGVLDGLCSVQFLLAFLGNG